MTTLVYNSNEREHVNAADVLGSLQKAVDNGTIINVAHSYYAGHELSAEKVIKAPNTEYRKRDAVANSQGGKKGGAYSRTQNRVIVVRDTQNGALVEGEAYFWRHDNRIYKLGTGFFDRAKMWREM